jgi:hypothetical protein
MKRSCNLQERFMVSWTASCNLQQGFMVAWEVSCSSARNILHPKTAFAELVLLLGSLKSSFFVAQAHLFFLLLKKN